MRCTCHSIYHHPFACMLDITPVLVPRGVGEGLGVDPVPGCEALEADGEAAVGRVSDAFRAVTYICWQQGVDKAWLTSD